MQEPNFKIFRWGFKGWNSSHKSVREEVGVNSLCRAYWADHHEKEEQQQQQQQQPGNSWLAGSPHHCEHHQFLAPAQFTFTLTQCVPEYIKGIWTLKHEYLSEVLAVDGRIKLKLLLKKLGGNVWNGFIWLGQRPMAHSCEKGNELSCYDLLSYDII